MHDEITYSAVCTLYLKYIFDVKSHKLTLLKKKMETN